MTVNFTIPPAGLFILAVAVAMYICMKAWHSAEHRQAKGMAAALSGLFWVFAAALVYGSYRYF